MTADLESKEITFEEAVTRIVEDPFSIEKPGFALHEIHTLKKPLIDKMAAGGALTINEKMLMYRLRVADLMWCLDDCEGHMEWLEEDYKNLKKKLEESNK